VGIALAALAGLAAFLAFSIEPMAAKLLLPPYGGTPAVWSAALVFFQIALLVGYGWAHLGPQLLGARTHAFVQSLIVILPVLALPIALPGWVLGPSGVPQAAWILLVLAAMVGAPFAALSTTGPTAGRWYAASDARGSNEPFRLFAAGNAGSLLGLLPYPLVIEPSLDLPTQARVWAAGYVLFAVLTVLAATSVARRSQAASASSSAESRSRAGGEALSSPVDRAMILRWIGLAAIPSSLVVGVTAHLSTDVAAVPLLWVAPLALYLLTLVCAFARARPIGLRFATLALPVAAVAVVVTLADPTGLDLPVLLATHLGAFTLAALVCHGRLAEIRPRPDQLTLFTLAIALGGAIGGVLTAIVAPLILPGPYEYPIAFVLALLARSLSGASGAGRLESVVARLPAWVWYLGLAVVVVVGAHVMAVRIDSQLLFGGLVVGGLVLIANRPRVFAGAIAAIVVAEAAIVPTSLEVTRTFFGTYRVAADGAGRHALFAGPTIHGIQRYADPAGRAIPAGYYYPDGPVGDVMSAIQDERTPARIGVVGLGAGAMAAYGRRGDSIDFFEIDPAIEGIARNPALFTYLVDTRANAAVVIGDGRLAMAAKPTASYDLIVLDAFSSDAVPVHLLTREAFEIYLERLRGGGLIAINVSNRYLDLEREVGAVSADLGLPGIARTDEPPPEQAGDADSSSWVVLARSAADLGRVAAHPGWQTLPAFPGTRVWTDQYSDLVGILGPR
jgi:hypothetical protein